MSAMLAASAMFPDSSAAAAEVGCKLQNVANLPVSITNGYAIIPAKVNGQDVKMIVDTGAFWSTIFPEPGARLALKKEGYKSFTVNGASGFENVGVARIKDFSLANDTLHNFEFVVGGSAGMFADGLLGSNILAAGDLELDLASGNVKVFTALGCTNTNMAYWAAKSGQDYSTVDLESWDRKHLEIIGYAYLNGKKLRAQFDTGAPVSIISLRAAEGAGFSVKDPLVKDGGVTGGVTRGALRTWIAPFASFKIGDGEEIRNTHLRVADGLERFTNIDMLVGGDFFLSHHVFLSWEQHKLYLTYNGGEVFNLHNVPVIAESSQVGKLPAGDSEAAPTPRDDLPDADAYSRRASGYAARRQYTEAFADLQKAIELSPRLSGYYLQRARMYWDINDLDKSLEDASSAVALAPDDSEPRLLRSAIYLRRKDWSAAEHDLDLISAAVSPDSDLRYAIGTNYTEVAPIKAIREYTFWLKSRESNIRYYAVLNKRCWARALANTELNEALDDCARSIHATRSPTVYDSRALVYLRLSQYKKSLEDYDEALKKMPKSAWSLFGRGIDEMRLGMTASGQADIAAAKANKEDIAEEAVRWGIAP